MARPSLFLSTFLCVLFLSSSCLLVGSLCLFVSFFLVVGLFLCLSFWWPTCLWFFIDFICDSFPRYMFWMSNLFPPSTFDCWTLSSSSWDAFFVFVRDKGKACPYELIAVLDSSVANDYFPKHLRFLCLFCKSDMHVPFLCSFLYCKQCPVWLFIHNWVWMLRLVSVFHLIIWHDISMYFNVHDWLFPRLLWKQYISDLSWLENNILKFPLCLCVLCVCDCERSSVCVL